MDLQMVAVLRSLLADADAYKLPRRVKKDMLVITEELSSRHFLFRRMEKVPGDQLDVQTRDRFRKVQDLFYEMENVVDDFRSRVIVSRLNRTDDPAVLEGFVEKTKLKLKTAKARRRFAANIRDIKRRVRILTQEVKCCFVEDVDRRRRYYMDFITPTWHDMATDSWLPALYGDSEKLVGLDGPRDELVNLLTEEGSTSNQQLKVASIVGVGGVGKTTLADEVYRMLKPRFDCAAFVSVSSNDMKMVFSSILSQIGQLDHANFEDVDELLLINKTKQALEHKRYFVVVDDIWDLKAWDTIKTALFDNNGHGNVVITTTRKDDVAKHVGGVYKLEPLSVDDSKKLLSKRLLLHEDKCPPNFAEISEMIIGKCGGLPLSIISIASSLASSTLGPEKWNQVYDTICYGVERSSRPRHMAQIQALSYAKLPSHLKPCFQYSSMYKPGCEINAEHLVWGWIAEGFIHEQEGKDLQEVGECYLNKLIEGSLIQPVFVDISGKAQSFCVDDMVHELITPTDRGFATILDGQQSSIPSKVHRLSIQGKNIKHHLQKIYLSNSHVRSLIVSGDADFMPPLSNFQDLRVLDLGGCDFLQNVDIEEIGNLSVLKCLIIGGKHITCIPKEIENLQCLQTLDLRASNVKELPESIVLVRTLKRLYVNSRTKIPDGIGKIKDLEELGDINISKLQLLKELRDLIHLRVLGIAIWSWDESYNDPLLEYLSSLVLGREHIQSLSILSCCSLDFMDDLGAHRSPKSLQKLEIKHSMFFTLPRWICLLQNLSSLSIEVYELSQEIIDKLGQMNKLRALSLTSKHAAKETLGFGTDGFHHLTSLYFVNNAMGKMFSPRTMQKLERLELSFQASRTKDVYKGFDFGLENLYSLKHVRIKIICFSASLPVVEDAEAAIRDAIPGEKLDIQRVRAEDMIKDGEDDSVHGKEQENGEEEVSDIKQEQKKKPKKKKKKKSSGRKIRL